VRLILKIKYKTLANLFQILLLNCIMVHFMMVDHAITNCTCQVYTSITGNLIPSCLVYFCLVHDETGLCSSLFATFIAKVLLSFMYFQVLSEIKCCTCNVVVFATWVLFSYMFRLLVVSEFLFEVALCPHSIHTT
jgi:hypothetical protein